jgi:hypothetical protein
MVLNAETGVAFVQVGELHWLVSWRNANLRFEIL